MPYGVDLKDERRTSNIELKTNIQYRTFNHAKAWFLFGRFDILVTKILINSSFCFIFFHSTFDVGRSMFDVHFLHTLLGKIDLALM
jgi:hypothetical protein